jgi:hypothetical protein
VEMEGSSRGSTIRHQRLGAAGAGARQRSVMSSDDLRTKTASLHDRIEQVLQLHPKLRALTGAKALSPDLYVGGGGRGVCVCVAEG